MYIPIHGLVAAPLTPMQADGQVNYAVIPTYATFLARNGITGAFVCGTTGESLSLTTAERLAVAEQWTASAPADMKVIVHVGHTSLEECRTLAAHAQRVGAGAIGAMAPVFFRPATVDDLIEYCQTVASAAPALPFYYYHIPSMTGVNFPMADFLQRAGTRIPTLAGVKFTSENLMDYTQCLQVGDGKYDMLFGRDEILLGALALGARGAVGSTYNFLAPLFNTLMSAFAVGDLATARTCQYQAIQIIHALFASHRSSIAIQKAVMGMIGIDCGPARSPLANMTAEEQADMRAMLERIGFFSVCSR